MTGADFKSTVFTNFTKQAGFPILKMIKTFFSQNLYFLKYTLINFILNISLFISYTVYYLDQWVYILTYPFFQLNISDRLIAFNMFEIVDTKALITVMLCLSFGSILGLFHIWWFIVPGLSKRTNYYIIYSSLIFIILIFLFQNLFTDFIKFGCSSVLSFSQLQTNLLYPIKFEPKLYSYINFVFILSFINVFILFLFIAIAVTFTTINKETKTTALYIRFYIYFLSIMFFITLSNFEPTIFVCFTLQILILEIFSFFVILLMV